MTTYYYQPLTELPCELLQYFNKHQYPLSLKKKYIISQVLLLSNDTDLDLLLFKTSLLSNSISRTSIYLVLQWMVTHNMVIKTVYEHGHKILYRVNEEKLNVLGVYNHNIATFNLALSA
jgi:Fe2+ or Zn2+ uptake regulation protein